jgi:hypothetical protein
MLALALRFALFPLIFWVLKVLNFPQCKSVRELKMAVVNYSAELLMSPSAVADPPAAVGERERE